MASIKEVISKPLNRPWLFWLAVFLSIFIPLYPKFPLFDVLPGYIVRVRLEDFFILVFALIYLGLWILGKVKPLKNPLFWIVVGYLAVGAVSGLVAIFIIKTIPMESVHILKWALHWARRVEYFFPLFLFYDGFKNRDYFKNLILVLTLVVLATAVYGFGQKYAQWPVYSTMNREFAKGWRLVLTEHARVPSTFAGHYDLAAFLVLVLPLTMGAVFYSRSLSGKILGWSAFISGYTLLILTASRTSFLALAGSIILLFGFYIHALGWKKTLVQMLIITVFGATTFLAFGDLSGRFSQIINLSKANGYIANNIFHLDQKTPQHYVNISDQLALVADKTDIPPVPVKSRGSGSQGATGEESPEFLSPPDVYGDIPDLFSSVDSNGVVTIISKPRQYSVAAFTYGLSSAIRFDALWPRAIAGFKKNPLLGSGYSTLVKVQVTDFTEAESTDNDYLRALGETGLLGFFLFYGAIVYAAYLIWKSLKTREFYEGKAVLAAVLVGILGLLINATYIDVFEASKVALAFWGLIGASIAYGKTH
ncbi:O-antigen ligase family protein [Candidatus Collierbacteria bacterium]|nr:O-antigen ligase family protein [Candidatus Collierbacteria bacterium]